MFQHMCDHNVHTLELADGHNDLIKSEFIKGQSGKNDLIPGLPHQTSCLSFSCNRAVIHIPLYIAVYACCLLYVYHLQHFVIVFSKLLHK